MPFYAQPAIDWIAGSRQWVQPRRMLSEHRRKACRPRAVGARVDRLYTCPVVDVEKHHRAGFAEGFIVVLRRVLKDLLDCPRRCPAQTPRLPGQSRAGRLLGCCWRSISLSRWRRRSAVRGRSARSAPPSSIRLRVRQQNLAGGQPSEDLECCVEPLAYRFECCGSGQDCEGLIHRFCRMSSHPRAEVRCLHGAWSATRLRHRTRPRSVLELSELPGRKRRRCGSARDRP